MRKPALILGTLLVMLVFVRSSYAQDKIEVFGGYSYVQAPIAVTGPLPPCGLGVCPSGVAFSNQSANGWEAAGVFKANRWLGVAADFGGNYRSIFLENFRQYTFLFGPQVSLPGRISPFAHALFGVAHQTGGATTATTFSSAIGGGMDLKLGRNFSVRIVQADALFTRYGGGMWTDPRISTGFVVRF
jgi:hypothetical protein